MAEVLEKELKFPVKRSLDGWGRGGVALDEALREVRAHQEAWALAFFLFFTSE